MERLSHEEWSAINGLCLSIHLSTDTHSLRTTVLNGLKKLIPYDRAFFDLAYYADGDVIFFDPVFINMSQKRVHLYFKYFQMVDYARLIFIENKSAVYRDTSLLPDSLREESILFKKWMQPMGMFFAGGFSVMEKKILYGSANLFRCREHGDFTAHELEILRILNTHISKRFHYLFPSGLTQSAEATPESINFHALTSREMEVMECICEGLLNKEIADKLKISEFTIKKHIGNIFRKMNVTNRYQLMSKIYHTEQDDRQQEATNLNKKPSRL
ncbi:MAG TPA: helix-turn-helix transcriptional regulator [Clostridia bacterium]|nr:helix-turn-helix transcriptional regulator [Clostridia bacterium]